MTASFYDQLAPFYHLLYEDWDRAIERQGAALEGLLREHGVAPGQPILDAAAGIGTQTIGLAARGYQVTASDLSAGAIARLEHELSRRSLRADARVDDLLSLQHTPTGSMDAVLACDNSLPHLLTDDALLQALRSCLRCCRAGGVAIFSLRDYAQIERKTPDVRPYGLRHENGQRFLAVQVWEWQGDQYDLCMYLTTEAADGACRTQVLKSRYYAVTIDRLIALMHEAGFVDIARRDDVLFQPVLIGRRPGATTRSPHD